MSSWIRCRVVRVDTYLVRYVSVSASRYSHRKIIFTCIIGFFADREWKWTFFTPTLSNAVQRQATQMQVRTPVADCTHCADVCSLIKRIWFVCRQ